MEGEVTIEDKKISHNDRCDITIPTDSVTKQCFVKRPLYCGKVCEKLVRLLGSRGHTSYSSARTGRGSGKPIAKTHVNKNFIKDQVLFSPSVREAPILAG